MKTLCISFVLLSLGSTLSAQIEPIASRLEVLAEARALLNNQEVEIEGLIADLKNPFVREATQAPPPVVTDSGEPAPPEARRLPDAVALEAIANKFMPTGSLVMGNRQVLLLDNGRSMPLGTRFRATISEFVYEVELSEVTSDGYTLRLNEATLTRSFMSKAERDQATLDRPARINVTTN